MDIGTTGIITLSPVWISLQYESLGENEAICILTWDNKNYNIEYSVDLSSV